MKFVSIEDKRPNVGDLVWFAKNPAGGLNCDQRDWTLCIYLKQSATLDYLSLLYFGTPAACESKISLCHNGRIHCSTEKPTNSW